MVLLPVALALTGRFWEPLSRCLLVDVVQLKVVHKLVEGEGVVTTGVDVMMIVDMYVLQSPRTLVYGYIWWERRTWRSNTAWRQHSLRTPSWHEETALYLLEDVTGRVRDLPNAGRFRAVKKVVRGNCGKRDEKRLETLYVDALSCCQYNIDQSQGRLAIKRRTNLVNEMHSLHLNIS